MKRASLTAEFAALAGGGFAADRAETLKWFLENEYGVRPGAAEKPKVSFKQVEPDAVIMDGKAVRKSVRCNYEGPYGRGGFAFTAFIPKSEMPAPAFVLICNRARKENVDPARKVKSGFWPAEKIVERGYATVTFFYGDLALDAYDRKVALTSGVYSVYSKLAQRQSSDWGVLSAWAWGASRIMDWIESEKTIDAAKVGIIGHSRGGKAALVAGVTDTRFAMTVSNNSGCGGAKLNSMDLPLSEPCWKFKWWGVDYWFCDRFQDVFPKNERHLPHDQDAWLALVAPRILCVRSAQADAWAGPEGERAATESASKTWWSMNKPENVDYSIREGKHDLGFSDWMHYLDIADERWRGVTVTVKGDDSAAIQKALDTKERPLTVIIPEGNYDITETLKVGSRTHIKAHPGARMILNGSKPHRFGDFLLSNADERGGNRDIRIEGGIWDGNKEVGHNLKEPQDRKFEPDAWSGATLNFRKVKGLSLSGMTLANSVTFNARFCEVDGFDIRNLRIVSPVIKNNQDGLHFGGYCFNGVVDGVKVDTKGQTNDDLIALNADDSITRHENRGTVNGPITNIVIRHVYAEDCHCFTRILRSEHDITGITIEDCTVGCRYNAINGEDARKWMAHGGARGGVKEEDLPESKGVLSKIVIRNLTAWPTVVNGFPLIYIEGKLAGEGVKIENFKRPKAKDSDPDRPGVCFSHLQESTSMTLTGAPTD